MDWTPSVVDRFYNMTLQQTVIIIKLDTLPPMIPALWTLDSAENRLGVDKHC